MNSSGCREIQQILIIGIILSILVLISGHDNIAAIIFIVSVVASTLWFESETLANTSEKVNKFLEKLWIDP